MEKQIKLPDHKVVEVMDQIDSQFSIANVGSFTDVIEYGVRMIGASSEWKETKGKGIKVAVLDTGIDFNHPDLKDNFKGGINFTSVDRNDYMDRQGHGTHCAGVIGASLNNLGIVGVAPEVELYAVKILGDDGSGSIMWIIDALEWCIQNKIDVVSMSLGSPATDERVHAAVQKACNAGIIMVAAAGNEGSGDDTVGYPARFPEVISVAAVDVQKNRGSFSSTGKEVEVAAAGVEIVSTFPNGRYAKMSGTSMACPHIAGAVAIFQAKAMLRYNRKLSLQEMRLLLDMYSEDEGTAGRDNEYGFGVFSFDRN